jgi:Protein of unknown function (DUF1566)
MKQFIETIVVLLVLVIFFSSAQAVIKIEQATVQNGVAFIQGNGAVNGAAIIWEGSSVTTANKNNGGFSFFGILPDDCTGDLTDGAETVQVAVLNCTPASAAAAPVPQTGQTASFATGDDGDLEKGVASPNPRFTVNVNAADDNGAGGGIVGNGICDGTESCNGTVTDNLTGLIWLKNANCFGVRTWALALSDVNGLNTGECGLTDGSVAGDWRLPNVRELQSLIDYGHNNPALPSNHPFTNVQASSYWSSSTVASFSNDAWGVNFDFGNVGLGDKNGVILFVPAVRGGS